MSLNLPRPPTWTSDALCAEIGPEPFFPELGDSTSAAKRICQRCDVRAECLAYALENGETSGIWGGVAVGVMVRKQRERPPVKRVKNLPIKHGTPSGYAKHYRDGEKPCDDCRDAQNEYKRNRRRAA